MERKRPPILHYFNQNPHNVLFNQPTYPHFRDFQEKPEYNYSSLPWSPNWGIPQPQMNAPIIDPLMFQYRDPHHRRDINNRKAPTTSRKGRVKKLKCKLDISEAEKVKYQEEKEALRDAVSVVSSTGEKKQLRPIMKSNYKKPNESHLGVIEEFQRIPGVWLTFGKGNKKRENPYTGLECMFKEVL